MNSEIQRLKKGMGVSDVGNRALGRVESVEADTFEMTSPDGGSISLRADVLFWVSDRTAFLVCDSSRLQEYEG